MMRALFLSVTMVGAIALPATASAKENRSVHPNPTNFSTPGGRESHSIHSYVSVTQEYEKGIRQYNKGNLHLAKAAFENVADARRIENYGQSVSYLGLIAMKRDDHETAVHYFKTALRGNPNVYGLKAVLGLSYVELGETKKANAVLAEMKRKQLRHYVDGSNVAERQSAIEVLDQALRRTSTT